MHPILCDTLLLENALSQEDVAKHKTAADEFMSWKRLIAILTQRCPVCLQGQLFRSLLAMHADCPVCGLHFERETGYFLNSMFAAYALGFLLLFPSAIGLFLWHVSLGVFSAVIVAETILLWPLIFRCSRVVWLHVDQMLDPRVEHHTHYVSPISKEFP
jgi:uncharacterized protein (DUF983 family)